MEKILVATDGSEPAGRAVDCAAELAKATGAKLRILTVENERIFPEEKINQIAEAKGDVPIMMDVAAMVDEFGKQVASDAAARARPRRAGGRERGALGRCGENPFLRPPGPREPTPSCWDGMAMGRWPGFWSEACRSTSSNTHPPRSSWCRDERAGGMARRNISRMAATWTRATMTGAGVRLVVSQPHAAAYIQAPMFVTREAARTTA